jgi:hypothetical protein
MIQQTTAALSPVGRPPVRYFRPGRAFLNYKKAPPKRGLSFVMQGGGMSRRPLF